MTVKNASLVGAALLLLTVNSVFASDITYLLDFQNTDANTVAPGFQVADGAVSFNAVQSPVFTLGTATLTFTDVNNYNLGNSTTERLTTDGFFTNSGLNSSFVISGLAANETVTLYGIEAWNSSGAAAFVSFGGGSLVDLGTSTSPSDAGGAGNIGDMILIAADVAPNISGEISGDISETNGITTRSEGQLGGFAVVISQQAVPEPASVAIWTALGLGLISFGYLQRRRKLLSIAGE